jgi:hypothetical protein
LQWGDEILITEPARSALRAAPGGESAGPLRIKRADDFLLLLAPASGACVALTSDEAMQIAAES